MRIDSSTVGMESARSYQASTISYRRFVLTDYTGVNNSLGDSTSGYAGLLSQGQKGEGEKETDEVGASSRDQILTLQEKMSAVRRNYHMREAENENSENIRQQTIRYIFELLFGDYKKRFHEWMEEQGTEPNIGTGTDTYYGNGSVNGKGKLFSDRAENATTGTSIARTMQVQVSRLDYTAVDYTYESENTSFSGTGTVRCADGREISFNVEVSMSREFERYYQEDLGLSTIQMTDPLVINLDGNVANVSDQKIFFDIDGDGTKDEINALGGGSMFLALDKNGNGTIDDGNELFGAKTGDGFGELAQYDTDGDGWIDEDDDVFDKLVVWAMGADGEAIQYSLKEAGVGAICVSRVGSQFSVTDEDNQPKAIVRSSGVFLYENGQAGTVQQMDMARYLQNA